MGRRTIRIADVGRVVTGKTPPTKNQAYYGHEYPFITPTDIDEVSPHVFTSRRISDKAHEKYRSSIIPPNSICFTCIASIGKTCISDDWSLTNQQINSIVVDHTRFDYRYIYYLLRVETPRIRALASGAATPIINKTMFSDIEIESVDLLTQRKIAAILSAYDDLIENNLRRIQILEEMAQNLYRAWFVKFRFPGHESLRMVDSELGDIPVGWEVVNVGSLLAKVPKTRRVKRSEYLQTGEIPVVDQGKPLIAGFTEDAGALISGPLPLVLFGDHTRALKYIDFSFARGADGTQILISNDDRMPPPLLYEALKEIDLSDFAYARHFKFLKEQKVMLPQKVVARAFSDIVNPLRDFAKVLRESNRNLSITRDLLLPKLISGELDVSDLDIAIPEEAA